VSFLAWIVVGLFAGLLARWITRDDRSGCIYTVAVGVIGAMIGGALMQAAGKKGIAELDLRAVLVSALGAVVLLLLLQAISGRIGPGRRR